MKYIKLLDLSGSEVKLNIDSQMKMRTKLGGFLTLVLIIIYMILFFFLGRNFYMRTNPNSSISVEMTEKYFNYTLNSTSMLFAFTLQNENSEAVDRPEFFYFELHYTVYKKTQDGTVLVIDEIISYCKCLPSDMGNNSVYTIQQLDSWYCFEWPDSGLSVGGLFHHELTQYLNIKLMNCHQAPLDYLMKNNITCSKDVTKLKQIFKDFLYISVMMQNFLVDSDSYSDSFKLNFL
jgi:hypothetical protein